jgi:hypothetical protein
MFFTLRSNTSWLTAPRQRVRHWRPHTDLTVMGNNGTEKTRKVLHFTENLRYKFGRITNGGTALLHLKGFDITRNRLLNLPLTRIDGGDSQQKYNTFGGAISNVDLVGTKFPCFIVYKPDSETFILYNKRGVRSSYFRIGETFSIPSNSSLMFYDFGLQSCFFIYSDSALSLCIYTLFFVPLSLFLNFLRFSKIWKQRRAGNLVLQNILVYIRAYKFTD